MPMSEAFPIAAAHAVLLAGFFFLTAQPLLGILQQETYSGRSMWRWFYKKGNVLRKRYSLLTLALVLIAALLSLCFSFAGAEIARLVATAGCAGMCVLFAYSFRHALKVPFRYTNRAKRLSVCYVFFTAAILFGVDVGLYFAAEAIATPVARALLRAVPLSLAPLAFPAILAAANRAMKLYENPRNRRFLARAKKMLAESDCIKVGITGSFAKTSVKHFAAKMLSAKYRVIATPASFNTPIGIARCVAKGGLDCDIFLAEMGARQTGDIAELCDMVCPKYAVVTGICAQHLETFGSLATIVREKGVLAKRAEKVVLGATANSLAKEGALVEGREFSATDIVCTAEGTDFELHIGENQAHIHTPLLGRHAAEDIALAAALCVMLGMAFEDVVAAVPSLEPVPHRLEHIEVNAVHILDDSYNSNVMGARDAVETLKLFSGKKFVVTPGERRDRGDACGFGRRDPRGRDAHPLRSAGLSCRGRRRQETQNRAHAQKSAGGACRRDRPGRRRAFFERPSR